MARMVIPAGDSARSTPKNFSFGLTRFAITSESGSKPSIIDLLAQFNEHAVSRRGMQEGHAAAVRSRHRGLVRQPVALRFQTLQVLLDVVDAEAEVVDPFAALLDELRDRGVGRGGLEQLEVRVADGEEGRL